MFRPQRLGDSRHEVVALPEVHRLGAPRRAADRAAEQPSRNSSRAISAFGGIRISTLPTRAAPTFPAGPTSQNPCRNGDGTAVTTPEAASLRP